MKTIYFYITFFLVFCFSCSVDEPGADLLAPTVSSSALNISYSSAKLKASVSSNGGKIGNCSFVVASDSSFVSNVQRLPVNMESGYGSVTVSSLFPSITYFYKLEIIRGISQFVSEVKTFTTLKGNLSSSDITLLNASNITFSTALLKATVQEKYEKITSATFVVSTKQDFSKDVIEEKATMEGSSVSGTISSLMPDTTYYYKLQVATASTMTSSEIKTFRTLVVVPPVVTTQDISDLTSNSVILRTTIQEKDEKVDSCTFFLSTKSDFSSNITKYTTTLKDGVASVKYTSLTPGTTYYYRLKIMTAHTTTYSELRGFKTPQNVFESFQVSNIDGNRVTLKMQLIMGTHQWSSVGIQYQSEYDSSPLTRTYVINSSGSYQISLKDLHPDAHYTITAFAVNELGKFESVLSIKTETAVYVDEAGTLPNIIAEGQKYKLTSLKIVGTLNGTDVVLIRDMAGAANTEIPKSQTSGILETLDLSLAHFVSGGTIVLSRAIQLEENGWIADKEGLPGILIQGTTSLKHLILPNYLKDVGLLSYVSLGSNLESLEVLNANQYLATVDGLLFNKNKTKLIACPSKISINHYAIPESVLEIGAWCFYECNNIFNITLSKNIKEIGTGAFENFSYSTNNGSTLIIPASIIEVGDYVCFYSGFKSIKFLANITNLPKSSIVGCPYLESVTLGVSIKTVEGLWAFASCPNLQEIHCLSSNPPLFINADKTTFDEVNKSTCTIYVPKGSASSYRSAAVWKEFSHIVEE